MTVGELREKLAKYDSSDEVAVALNTGDAGLLGRLDAVGYAASERIVTLVHIYEDGPDQTEVDRFMDAALDALM